MSKTRLSKLPELSWAIPIQRIQLNIIKNILDYNKPDCHVLPLKAEGTRNDRIKESDVRILRVNVNPVPL